MTNYSGYSELSKAVKAEAQKRGLTLPAKAQAETHTHNSPWTPQLGPQTNAYNCNADIIGYGGAAGGGKTDLLLGKAGTKHHRALILRREFPRVRGIIERSREIFNARNDIHAKDSYNESTHVWRLTSGRMIEFGAVQYDKDKDKYQGQPHDFIGFDEVTEFPKSIVTFLMAWNRTTRRGQHCQVVMTFNPPMNESGEWVTQYFGAWLDPAHPHPAQDGELRWYAMLDGEETEVESGEPFEHGGEMVVPKSRTFFHASLKDNPILAATGYGATIDALPEPLRSLLKGNFDAARIDNPYQVIPSDWIEAAMVRGRETHNPTTLQTAQGVDVARGGKDKTVIAERYDYWIAPLKKYPGRSTPDGPSVATLIIAALVGNPVVNIDVIGVGSSAYDHARDGCFAQPINFGEGTTYTDASGRLKFANVRAAAYWHLRELLDPANGYDVCLPDDPELKADLIAPRWEIGQGGRVRIESKADIASRLGRSPDCGDAVVLAFWGDEPTPSGIIKAANPPAQSAFARANVSGGRFGRGDDRRGWHRG